MARAIYDEFSSPLCEAGCDVETEDGRRAPHGKEFANFDPTNSHGQPSARNDISCRSHDRLTGQHYDSEEVTLHRHNRRLSTKRSLAASLRTRITGEGDR